MAKGRTQAEVSVLILQAAMDEAEAVERELSGERAGPAQFLRLPMELRARPV